MKKTLFTLLFIFTFSCSLFAAPSFLLMLEEDVPVIVVEYVHESKPYIFPYGVPMITADFEMPTVSPTKVYLGLKTFPAFIGVVLEADTKAGYAFEKPANWKNHHIELLGSFAAGAQLGFMDGFWVLPTCDVGFQVYWMSEQKGWFWGIGPNARLLFDIYHKFEVSAFYSLKLSAGYKF